MVGVMLEAVAFTMDPVTDGRRARVSHSPVSRRSIILDIEGSSLHLHERKKP